MNIPCSLESTCHICTFDIWSKHAYVSALLFYFIRTSALLRATEEAQGTLRLFLQIFFAS